jgi:hypothetical protein
MLHSVIYLIGWGQGALVGHVPRLGPAASPGRGSGRTSRGLRGV